LVAAEHSMNSEEVAFLQGAITRSTAAIGFKRRRGTM
jgi:hypothetical protein